MPSVVDSLTSLHQDIDAPIELGGSKAASNEPSQEQIGMIADMGFSHNQARKALRGSVGSYHLWEIAHGNVTEIN